MMVVDDDDQFRGMLRDWLMDEGVKNVVEAPDGPEALELAIQAPPDVILMDLRMPKMNGIEATRQIRALLPSAQIIMLSAYGDATFREAAEEAGVYGYVVKGGEPEALWHTIRFAWTYKVGLKEEQKQDSDSAAEDTGPLSSS
jgi:two-component system, NarL family, response regulator NreC